MDGVPVELKDEKTKTCLSLSANSYFTTFRASFFVSSFFPLRLPLPLERAGGEVEAGR